jgi:hypothetical protein
MYRHNNFADGLDFEVQFLSLILTKLKSTRKRRRLSLILLVSLTKKEISVTRNEEKFVYVPLLVQSILLRFLGILHQNRRQ